MKKWRITRSVGFQVLLYLVLGFSAFAVFFSLMNIIWGAELGLYSNDGRQKFHTQVIKKELAEMSLFESPFCYMAPEERDDAGLIAELKWISANHPVGYVVQNSSGRIIFSNVNENMRNSEYQYTISFDKMNAQKDLVIYTANIYVDSAFPGSDRLALAHAYGEFCYTYRFTMIWALALGVLFCLISVIWLICNAGYRAREEEPKAGVLYKVPLELIAFVWVSGCGILAAIASELMPLNYEIITIFIVSAAVALGTVWSMMCFREFVHRVKLGGWWKTTFVYWCLKLCWRMTKLCWKLFETLINGMPAVWPVVAMLAVLSFFEFVGLGVFRFNRAMIFICWFFEKLIIVPVVLYCVLAFERLLKGMQAISAGSMSSKVDTRFMVLGFKEQGECLNHIGAGISKAVEEKMRSERLKTELITNVSHDLKTPLTSVINYADLLAKTAVDDNENKADIAEYSEVLLRQANRLKKLLDDLVDASRASTGNIEMHLEPCELGVLLTQAAGEYEERFAQKELILRVNRPEEDIVIMADGRQLWRIFDNLFNNIFKYAQDGSRVYLSLETKENRAEMIFRNISKYELNVSSEELEERFVRGDASRHMEGSGLGLSIAKSLTELQNGTLQVQTDGDLFKVVISFPIVTIK